MAVYLLHFERPYPAGRRPQHYLGFSCDVEKRLAEHRAGQGARLLQVVALAGIPWMLARLWPEGDRALERRLKGWKKGAALCPECRASPPN